MLNKKEVESFLVNKRGYLKKSPLETLKAIWKQSTKHTLPKNKAELHKELDLVKSIQTNLRAANILTEGDEKTLLESIYHTIIEEKNRPKKVLFFDLEVSPNTVFTWNVGNKISISHDSIVSERAIICVCWKFEGSEKIHSIEWNKGCDYELVKKFAEIFNSSDIIIGQNSDQFDIKWLRTRCLVHGIYLKSKVNSIDTLKMARQNFRFNSNRLDYMSKFIGNEGKKDTSFGLWKDIVLSDSKEAMKTMVDYCKNDIVILEQVYNVLRPYCKEKKFKF